jgi:DNA-binding NarL/FixJ family response regulator
MPIRVLVADDHPFVRLGIRELLASHHEFEVVGEVADPQLIIAAVETLKPDVLVLDLVMRGTSTLHVIRQLAAAPTLVVVLSMHANEAYVVEALWYGAAAYLLKGSEESDLLQAIHAVVGGARFVSASLVERGIEPYGDPTSGGPSDPYGRLTAREQEVLRLAADGYSNREIAARLELGVRTVESHRTSLMRKLGIRTHTDLVRYAWRRGIVPLA